MIGEELPDGSYRLRWQSGRRDVTVSFEISIYFNLSSRVYFGGMTKSDREINSSSMERNRGRFLRWFEGNFIKLGMIYDKSHFDWVSDAMESAHKI